MTNEQRKAQMTELLNKLSSAYQEDAIGQAIDEYYDFDGIDEEQFTQDACDFYRDILKSAGNDDVYKAFRQYGDETELDAIAREIYKLLK